MLPASLLQFPIPEAHEITKYEMNRKPSYKPSDDNELSSRTTLSLDNISKDTGYNITTIFIWKVGPTFYKCKRQDCLLQWSVESQNQYHFLYRPTLF